MKKIVLLIGLTLPLLGISQLSIKIGPTATYSNTWILNPNVFIDDSHSPELTFGMTYGADAELKLTNWLGFYTGYMVGEHGQNFRMKPTDGPKLDAQHMFQTAGIPLMVRIGNAVYFESGFEYQKIKSASWTLDGVEMDVSDSFINQNWLVNAGFGGNIRFSDLVELNIGIRTAYGLKDNLGIDGFGRTYEDIEFYSDLLEQGANIEEYQGYEEFTQYYSDTQNLLEDFNNLSKTYSLRVGVMVGVKFHLGGTTEE